MPSIARFLSSCRPSFGAVARRGPWAVGLLLCGVAAAQPVWETEEVLNGRRYPAVAYDSLRGHVLLVAGDMAEQELDDAWVWDGRRWARESYPIPSPVQGAAMAYDAGRDEMVLFGGNLWEFWRDWTLALRGGQWQNAGGTVRPEARTQSAMAYDAARGRVVLFGGRNYGGTWLTDTWEWDGSAWQSKSPQTVPTSGARPFLTWDGVARQVVLAFGGAVWRWNGQDWSPAGTTPGQVTGPIAHDDRADRLLLFDGKSSWEQRGGVWSQLSGLPAGSGFGDQGAFVYDAQRGEALLYTGDSDAETWRLRGSTWSRLMAAVPSPRARAQAVYDPVRRRILLHGGSAGFGSSLADTWEWDGDRWIGFPAAVQWGDLIYDESRGRPVLIDTGGQYEWDGTAWRQWSDVPTPARGLVARDSRRGVTVLDTGTETWEWDGASWHAAMTTPRFSYGASMVYDESRGVVVYYNGQTWEWDGTAWTMRQPAASPTEAIGVALAYDPIRRVVVAAGGGEISPPTRGTWEWDGTSWTPAAALPIARGYAAMAYDTARQRMLLFGGGGSMGMPYSLSDTLIYLERELRTPDSRPAPGQNAVYQLDLPAEAGSAYALGLSFGRVPGLPLVSRPGAGLLELPLVDDALLRATAGALAGVLDGAGRAGVAIPLPDTPEMVDAAWYAAAVTVGMAGLGTLTDEVRIVVRR